MRDFLSKTTNLLCEIHNLLETHFHLSVEKADTRSGINRDDHWILRLSLRVRGLSVDTRARTQSSIYHRMAVLDLFW